MSKEDTSHTDEVPKEEESTATFEPVVRGTRVVLFVFGLDGP